MRKHHGVIDTEVGYTGGFSTSAKYEEVKTGKTGHAEAVKITFDPNVISYAKILEYFFRIHDPTTINRQGNDIGSQYRSAIFYLSEEQKDVAKKIVSKVNATNFWKSEVVTEIVPSGLFIKAEEYHQKYLQKKPDGYTCHYERPFNFETKRP